MFAKILEKIFPKKALVTTNRDKTRHEIMKDSLAYSEKMLGKRFNVHKAQVVYFECITSNIIQFNEELKRLNKILTSGKAIKPTEAIFDVNPISLDQFFIDENTNSYINQAEYRVFHNLASIFCQLTEEGSTADYGIQEHNYRSVSMVIRSIIKICEAIDKATQ